MYKLLVVPSNPAYVTSPFSIIKIIETTEALLVLRKLLICLLNDGGSWIREELWTSRDGGKWIDSLVELEMTVIADRLNSQEK